MDNYDAGLLTSDQRHYLLLMKQSPRQLNSDIMGSINEKDKLSILLHLVFKVSQKDNSYHETGIWDKVIIINDTTRVNCWVHYVRLLLGQLSPVTIIGFSDDVYSVLLEKSKFYPFKELSDIVKTIQYSVHSARLKINQPTS